MNIGNLIVLALAFTFVLFFAQRTERKRAWLPVVLLILPASFLIYRWAIYKDQLSTAITAAIIGLALNMAYWLLYGRAHPPHSSDEITVVGSEQ